MKTGSDNDHPANDRDFAPVGQGSQNVDSLRLNQANLQGDPLVGTTIGDRYQVLSVLGSGGMSIVYKAKLKSVDKNVAIKTLNTNYQWNPTICERFSREIVTLAKLEHPNIVTVHDCLYGPNGQAYLVMDLLTGRGLDQVLRSEGPLSIERARKICIQVCSAVKFAHNSGVIHRDLKPGNIMLLANEEDFVKVVDFGLAHLKGDDESRRITQTGEFWGSPAYMSPEQIKAESIDVRSDIYSLGCVLYEMLSGRDPFYGCEIFELLQKHVNDRAPGFKEVNRSLQIPSELEAIVFKAIAKKRENRFQSMAEFQSALESMDGVMKVFDSGRKYTATIVPSEASLSNLRQAAISREDAPVKTSPLVVSLLVIAIVLFGSALVVVALLLTQTPKVGTADSTEAAPHEKPNLPVTTKSTVESGNVVNQDASKNLSGQRSSVKSSQRPSRPRTKSISNADHAKKASKPAIKASKPAIKARHIPNEVQSVHHVDKAKPQSKPSVVKAGNPWDKLKSRLSNEAKNDSE